MKAVRLLPPLLLLPLLHLLHPSASAEAHKPVVVSGTVPDEAARAAILGKLRGLYGDDGVVDQIEVGGVTPAANWVQHATRLIDADLRHIRNGEVRIVGQQVSLTGSVTSEATRQQLIERVASALSPNHIVRSALTVADAPQAVLDRTLADRVIEFESGSATLTAAGIRILDEMAASIATLADPRIQIVGHTDSHGNRLANIGLSLERANAVRDYLSSRGIPAETMTALGAGPDAPVAGNDTAEGRARNRRIEFRIQS